MKSEPAVPEAPRRILGRLRDGAELTLAPMTSNVAGLLSVELAAMDPWANYGVSPAALERSLSPRNDGAARHQILAGAALAGAIVIHPAWLVGPYLQLLAVLPAYQASGVGSRVLGWYEAEARASGARNIWLCVTGSNDRAQRVYRRHGFAQVACLDDLIRDGDRELLFRKQLR